MILHILVVLCLFSCWLSAESVACNEKCARCEEGRCKECNYGWFGHDCNAKCKNCWISGCHKHSGKCNKCRPGRYKEDCGTLCPDNCRPDRGGPAYCRRNDGKCLDGCKEGFWGNTCSQTCKNCETGYCLQNNGHCSGDCEVGWHGPSCDKACSPGCLNNRCNWNNGVCTHGCNLYMYGKNCAKECSTNCYTRQCDGNGRCHRGCIDGFRGKTCNETCPINCLTCNQDNNICTKCKAQWSGEHCQNMDEKEAGKGATEKMDWVVSEGVDPKAEGVDPKEEPHKTNGGGPRCGLLMLTYFICITLYFPFLYL